jgi:ANTAR domain
LTERAKGVLMERHAIDEESAVEMLRSRSDNRKLIDLAAAVVDGYRLLPRQPQAPSQPWLAHLGLQGECWIRRLASPGDKLQAAES